MLRNKVEEALEKIRPALKQEGGDIELIDLRDSVVYVRLIGACATCSMSMLTMKNLVETTLRSEVPEVTQVKAV